MNGQASDSEIDHFGHQIFQFVENITLILCLNLEDLAQNIYASVSSTQCGHSPLLNSSSIDSIQNIINSLVQSFMQQVRCSLLSIGLFGQHGSENLDSNFVEPTLVTASQSCHFSSMLITLCGLVTVLLLLWLLSTKRLKCSNFRRRQEVRLTIPKDGDDSLTIEKGLKVLNSAKDPGNPSKSKQAREEYEKNDNDDEQNIAHNCNSLVKSAIVLNENETISPRIETRALTNDACKNCHEVAGKKDCFYGLCKNCCVYRKDTLCRAHGTLLVRMSEQIRKSQNRLDLDFSYCNLSIVPESICSIQHLLSLNLSDNRIQFLPENIGGMASLEELFLHYNCLIRLPPSIVQLSNLAELRLKNNMLSSLPEDIGRLQKLKVLILTNNRLKSLPVSIGKLVHLEELAVHANCLKSLPEEFTNLTNLSILYLGENLIENLPENFGNLKNLTECDLSKCRLRCIPDSIGELRSLERMWLNDNLIRDLFNSWSKMESLVDFFVRNNQICCIPWQLGRMQLSNLNFHSNPLLLPSEEGFRDFEAVALGVPSLKELAARALLMRKAKIEFDDFPKEISNYLRRVKWCSMCNGPFFEYWWSRIEFADFSFNTHVPLYLQLCSLNHEKELRKIISTENEHFLQTNRRAWPSSMHF